jgi:hypothetical protein
MKIARLALLLVLVYSVPRPARAGVDAPGTLTFDFVSSDSLVFQNWEQVPQEGVQMDATAYFSSDASRFGENGVLIWAGFEFLVDGSPRTGIVLVDLDLSLAPLDGVTPIPHSAIRAEYLEKWQEQVFFAGEVGFGDIWLVDVFFHEDDDGALEGDLALVFFDPSGVFPGSRVLVRGRFVSQPSPGQLRRDVGIPDTDERGAVYIDTSCSGELYLADDTGEGCDCGGDDTDSGGCEGDTSGDSGCEGDSGGGCADSGCQGDTGGGCSGDAAGGCGDMGGGGSCGGGGGGNCATSGIRIRRGAPIRGVMRFFPEIVVFAFIFWMKKKVRK